MHWPKIHTPNLEQRKKRRDTYRRHKWVIKRYVDNDDDENDNENSRRRQYKLTQNIEHNAFLRIPFQSIKNGCPSAQQPRLLWPMANAWCHMQPKRMKNSITMKFNLHLKPILFWVKEKLEEKTNNIGRMLKEFPLKSMKNGFPFSESIPVFYKRNCTSESHELLFVCLFYFLSIAFFQIVSFFTETMSWIKTPSWIDCNCFNLILCKRKKTILPMKKGRARLWLTLRNIYSVSNCPVIKQSLFGVFLFSRHTQTHSTVNWVVNRKSNRFTDYTVFDNDFFSISTVTLCQKLKFKHVRSAEKNA